MFSTFAFALTLLFGASTILVAGVPIQVIRTYDSRDSVWATSAWGGRSTSKTFASRRNRNIGLNWQQSFSPGGLGSYCLLAPRPRVVTITFPDGTTQKFKAHASPECQIVQPIQVATVEWRPLQNTRGTLHAELSDGDEVTTQGFSGGASCACNIRARFITS